MELGASCSEISLSILGSSPLRAQATGFLLLTDLLKSFGDPLAQPVGAFLLLLGSVVVKLLLEGGEPIELLLGRIERWLSEEIDVASERVSLLIDNTFNPGEEFVTQGCDLLLLVTLSEASAHLLYMLETHITAPLIDFHECLSLGIRIWVSSLAELLSSTKHVRSINFS